MKTRASHLPFISWNRMPEEETEGTRHATRNKQGVGRSKEKSLATDGKTLSTFPFLFYYLVLRKVLPWKQMAGR